MASSFDLNLRQDFQIALVASRRMICGIVILLVSAISGTSVADWSENLGSQNPTRESDPSRVYEVAENRGISREIVDAAISGDEEFAQYGERGFQALCLLIETGSHDLETTYELMKQTRYDGGEDLLLRLANSKGLSETAKWLSLKALGLFDTQDVRTYLLERIKNERDAKTVFAASLGLAKLKESRAIEILGARILQSDFELFAAEEAIIQAMHLTDSKSTHLWLQSYLAEENSRCVGVGVALIARSDSEMAAKIASRLLRERSNLTEQQQNFLGEFLDDLASRA